MRKPKQPGSAPHTHGWALGVQGQLMLFLCGITVLTLGLVWGLIQGYGAGASVTAAGVFADIMSIANI